MIKIFISIALIAMIFVGCVGTVVATNNNVRDSRANAVYNAKTNNELNKTKKELNKK
jgi:PBP1b-binding outer membrane lipoprotein LpoB